MKRVAALSLALVLASAPGVSAGEARHMTIRKTDTGVKGVIHASEACADDQLVKVQKKSSSGWKTVAKTRTGDDARYKKRIDLKSGKKYRTLSPQSANCDKVVSRKITG